MKALSVHQPWAGLLALGTKTIETRTYKTAHRGPVVICSTRKDSMPYRHIIVLSGLWDPDKNFPEPCAVLGHALAIADLVDCRPMTDDDIEPAVSERYHGAWAWVFENAQQYIPLPVRGQQRLWELDVPTGWVRV